MVLNEAADVAVVPDSVHPESCALASLGLEK